MLTEDQAREVLRMLSDAGLCVCERSIIEPSHLGMCEDHEYIIGRIEGSGGFGSDGLVTGTCTDGIEGIDDNRPHEKRI